jgi:DNA primase
MVVDRPSEPFVLPESSRELRTTDWLERWPAVTPDLAKQYGWYVAEIGGYEHLVMPITRGGQPIFYSARALDSLAPKKYHYPAGIERKPWLSDDTLARQPVFLCEGVADAVALSPYGSSVGLLGGFYNGGLNDLLKGKEVVVAFDGDFQGYCMAVQVATKISSICNSIVYTVAGKDPSDWDENTMKMAKGTTRDPT